MRPNILEEMYIFPFFLLTEISSLQNIKLELLVGKKNKTIPLIPPPPTKAPSQSTGTAHNSRSAVLHLMDNVAEK